MIMNMRSIVAVILCMLWLVTFCNCQTGNFRVQIGDAVEIRQQTVEIRWSIVPSITLAFVRIMHSSDNWATSSEIPIEFILLSANDSALINNNPYDMMNYYKVSACDMTGLCSPYSDSTNAVDSRIVLKLDPMEMSDEGIMIDWYQENKFEYPISNLKLEVAVNSGPYVEIANATNYFKSTFYFIRKGFYTKDLSKYSSITFTTNDNEGNIKICQQSALTLQVDYRVYLFSSADNRCYFSESLNPFFVMLMTDINDISGYLAVNTSSYTYKTTLTDPMTKYSFRMSYKTVFNPQGGSASAVYSMSADTTTTITTKAPTISTPRLDRPNDSGNTLAIAIAVPIACTIFLILVIIGVLIAYRFIRYGSIFTISRSKATKRSRMYENAENINTIDVHNNN